MAAEFELVPDSDEMTIGTDKMLALLSKLADAQRQVRMLQLQIRDLSEQLAELRNSKGWQQP